MLLERKHAFTALFAYNDASAIGAIRAIREAGLRVPEDVSVVGFDDIQAAMFHSPALTTVRQPLHRMGEIAAKILLDRLDGQEDWPKQVAVQPELVVRESTAKAAKTSFSPAPKPSPPPTTSSTTTTSAPKARPTY